MMRTLDILFPSVCLVCDSDIRFPEKGPVCPLCLRSFRKQKNVLNPSPDVIDDMIIPFEYEGTLRDTLKAFKFKNRDDIGPLLVQQWSLKVNTNPLSQDIDVVVSVPSSCLRDSQRGFNPAHCLALAMAKIIGKPIVNNAIKRRIFHWSQKKFDRNGRFINAARGFYIGCKPGTFSKKTILLVDDVCTTGATLATCAALLKNLGAYRVVATAISQDNINH